MEINSIGELIAIRKLYLIGDKREIVVKIGMPTRFIDSPDFYCPFQIIGIESERVRYAGGIDAIQALFLALSRIGAILYTSDEAKIGILKWLSDESDDLGFPVPESIKDSALKK